MTFFDDVGAWFGGEKSVFGEDPFGIKEAREESNKFWMTVVIIVVAGYVVVNLSRKG